MVCSIMNSNRALQLLALCAVGLVDNSIADDGVSISGLSSEFVACVTVKCSDAMLSCSTDIFGCMNHFTEAVISGTRPSNSAASALYTCFTGSTCGYEVGNPSPSPSPSPTPAPAPRPTYNTVSAVSEIWTCPCALAFPTYALVFLTCDLVFSDYALVFSACALVCSALVFSACSRLSVDAFPPPPVLLHITHRRTVHEHCQKGCLGASAMLKH
jgi:hypothetical protein